MKNKLKKWFFSVLAVAFWIFVWAIAARIANRDLLLKIPLPADTIKALFENICEAQFWKNVGTSLLHILLGFISAVILGLICGLISGNSQIFKTLTSPIVHLIRAVPIAAFIVLAWLWVPNTILPSFISFLTVFPIAWGQVESGLLSVDKKSVEMATVMGMSRIGVIKHIKIPTILPFFRDACIMGLGFAWKSGVAAEVICNPTGSIGAMLSSAKTSIDYPGVFAVTLMIVLLSIVMEKIISVLWKEKRYD